MIFVSAFEFLIFEGISTVVLNIKKLLENINTIIFSVTYITTNKKQK